jgi:hypothetical protein
MYYEVHIPACNRTYPLGSEDRAICYQKAIDVNAEARAYCRDHYADLPG